MTPARVFVLAVALSALAPVVADAADRQGCLTQHQRRAAVASRKAVPLTRAIRIVRARLAGEVLKVRLCSREKGLVYVLTVLARDGKVTRATLDAADGRFVGGAGG